MVKRKKTFSISYNKVKVGDNAPITVQSMTNTPTSSYKKTLNQIKKLENVNCDIIRIAVKNRDDIPSLKKIIKQTSVPIIADIQFDYKMAVMSIKSGVAGLRLNPGNITEKWKIEEVIKYAKGYGIPIRIGVNHGSLEKKLLTQIKNKTLPTEQAIVESASKEIRILEDNNFTDIIVSLKSSDVFTTIKSNELFSKKYKYPIHLGVTEAGPLRTGLVKSSIGISYLLMKGIGDTIRVSLTSDPVEEVSAGFSILKILKLREDIPEVISCPTCGRCSVNLIKIAEKVENMAHTVKKNIKIAVMGCVVNGPGEAKEADIGVTFGKNQGILFKKGKIIKKLKESEIIKTLKEEINKN